jgi:predicted nucleic acid-binding protein
VSIVALVEMWAAFHRLHRQRLISAQHLDQILSRFYGDFRMQRFGVLDVTAHELDLCHQLIFQHHVTAGDAVILAAALTTQAQQPVFVCVDVRSGLLARPKRQVSPPSTP